jgi:uncharacterized membrane protein YkoI
MSRFLIALSGLLVAPALMAASPGDVSAPAVSKARATKAALAEVRGKVTSSRIEQVDGQPVYVFGIAAPQQPIVWVRVSGVTGKVL